MHKKIIVLFCLTVLISFHLFAQCDSEVEFLKDYRFSKNAVFQENRNKLSKDGFLYEIIFFNDLFLVGDSVFRGDSNPGLLNYSNFLILCADSFGNNVWMRNYSMRTIQFPKFFISRSVFYLHGDYLYLLCLQDPGNYSLPNDDTLKLEKRALVLLEFRTVDGTMVSHKVLIKALNQEMFNVATLPAITYSTKDQKIHMALPLSDSMMLEESIVKPENLNHNELAMIKWKADGNLELFSRIGWSEKRFGQNSMDVFGVGVNGDHIIVNGTFSKPLYLKSGKTLYADSTLWARDVYVLQVEPESHITSKAISIGGHGSERVVSFQLTPKSDLVMLVNSLSFELLIDHEEQIPSYVNSFNVIKLDENLVLKGSALLRPSNESVDLDSKFIPHLSLDFNQQVLVQVGLFDEDIYLDGSLLNPRSSGMTFYHLHFDDNFIPFKKNVFWSSKPFIINMIDEWNGKALYRGLCSDTIFGSAMIPYLPPYNMVFHMQKCIKNILRAPESQTDNHTGLYPNPFSHKIQIPGKLMHQALVIKDVLGKTMYEGVPRSLEISTTHWSKGMYLVHVLGFEVQKLIKY